MRTDKEMLALLKSDPETGMACLIDAFAPVVWAAAARVLPQPEDVRECVNDTFTEFYFKQDAFDPGKGTLKSWLALLARRRAIDRLRAAKTGGEAQPLDESLPAPSGLTPEDRLALQEALARLSPEEAELIRLQYFEGYTPKEIADRLGLPYETVKKRRQRALARLRKSLLATLILVLLALLAACGYAVLRYFGILPGYGVNTDAETPFYILAGEAAGENDLAAVEITDAVLADGQLSVQIVLTRGPDAADSQIGSGELASTVPWHHMLTTMYAPKPRVTWAGGEAAFTGYCSTQDGLAMDGSALETPDAVAYEILFSCEAADLPAGGALTLDLGWLQLDFALEPAQEDAPDRYSYELGEYGGVLAIPQLLAGRLVVDLYPLDGEEFAVEPGMTCGTYRYNGGPAGQITAAGPGGAVYTGQNLNYTPLNETGFSRWDFGPAEPGRYALTIPYVYLNAPLPEDLVIPLPEGGGPWAVAGGTLAAQVGEELPAGCAQPPVGGSVNYTLQPDGTLAEEETPAPTPYYVQFTLTGAPEALTFAGLNLFAVAEDPLDPTAVSGSWINSGGLYDEAAYQVWQGVYAAFHPLALERSPRLTAVSESGFGAPPRRAQISYRWDHAFVLEIDVK